jgi:hemerythrin
MLQWTEKFETGHPQIDFQHKLLINYINKLDGMAHTTNPTRQEVEFIINLVDFVETYTTVHFKHEESCMKRHQCAAYTENKFAHQEFLRYYADFKRRLANEGCRPEVLRDLHENCTAWIQGHILTIDVKLKDCLAREAVEAH